MAEGAGLEELESLQIYSHGRRDQNKIALTFDDGPNPPRTDQILAILAEKGATGTFFVLGKWVERFPLAFRRIIDAGHVVGNHSFLHDPELGDFDRAEAVIAEYTGRPSRFLRAPLFHFHLCLQTPLVTSDRVKIVDADVNPADWSRTKADDIITHVFANDNLAGGSILDLHDGAETENDAVRLERPIPLIEALPDMIDEFLARGFELVGLDDMELVDPKEHPT